MNKVRIRLLDKVGDVDGTGNVEGAEVETETYVWAEDEKDLEEGEWDFAEFRREKMSRWIGGNEEYQGELRPSILGSFRGVMVETLANGTIEVDEAVRAQGKDPTGGRGASGAITEALEARKTDEALASAV